MDLLSEGELPDGFVYPSLFLRAVESGLVGLEPWWLLEGGSLRVRVSGMRQRFPDRLILPFARREDNDDVACWDLEAGTVAVIHDFASPGWEQRGTFPDFEAWLRAAVDDFVAFEQ